MPAKENAKPQSMLRLKLAMNIQEHTGAEYSAHFNLFFANRIRSENAYCQSVSKL